MHTRVEAFKICCITTSPVRIDLTKGSPKKLDIKMPKKILSHCTSQVERKKIITMNVKNHISAYHFSFPQPNKAHSSLRIQLKVVTIEVATVLVHGQHIKPIVGLMYKASTLVQNSVQP